MDNANIKNEIKPIIREKLEKDSSFIGYITFQSSRTETCKLTLLFLVDGNLYGILKEYFKDADIIIPKNFLLYK